MHKPVGMTFLYQPAIGLMNIFTCRVRTKAEYAQCFCNSVHNAPPEFLNFVLEDGKGKAPPAFLEIEIIRQRFFIAIFWFGRWQRSVDTESLFILTVQGSSFADSVIILPSRVLELVDGFRELVTRPQGLEGNICFTHRHRWND